MVCFLLNIYIYICISCVFVSSWVHQHTVVVWTLFSSREELVENDRFWVFHFIPSLIWSLLRIESDRELTSSLAITITQRRRRKGRSMLLLVVLSCPRKPGQYRCRRETCNSGLIIIIIFKRFLCQRFPSRENTCMIWCCWCCKRCKCMIGCCLCKRWIWCRCRRVECVHGGCL